MDQDSFRQLLSSSRTPKPPAPGNVFKTISSKSKSKKPEPKPEFKPRTVKKKPQNGQDYRDRAAERRQGVAGDYAQVEALAEDFERRNAENEDRKAVEEQRRYLGGDSEHTVLVKGLDFALLEQNKARAAAATEDDDTLEEAFLETVNPKKRTREEIVAELKNKRSKNNGTTDNVAGEGTGTEKAVDKGLEEAKQAGKFRPIGFKPIGKDSKEGTKKKKVKKVKKGAKADKGLDAGKPATETTAVVPSQPLASTSKTKPLPQPEPEPIDDDFDIFADTGDYTGVDLGDDDEDEDSDMVVENPSRPPRSPERGRSPPHESDEPRTKWFDLDDEPKPIPQPPSHPAGSNDANAPHKLRPEDEHGSDREDETEDRQDEDMDSQEPIRLVPLSSSAIPSIKDILAMDDQVKKEDKRKARKEKKKGGGGSGSALTTEKKVERDYQRLKSYTEKRGGAS